MVKRQQRLRLLVLITGLGLAQNLSAVEPVGTSFGNASGANSYPVPLYMPDVEYPRELLKSKQAGEVRVRIFVKADGGVRYIEALNMASPSLIASARRAVERWRFEPWMPSGSDPDGETLTVTFRFSGKPTVTTPLTANVGIKKLLCGQLNKEVAENESRLWDKRVPHQLNVFRSTEHYLSKGPVISQFLTADERDRLIMDLYESVSNVIASCRANPMERYADYLPDSVRSVL
jgi:TonB family protein